MNSIASMSEGKQLTKEAMAIVAAMAEKRLKNVDVALELGLENPSNVSQWRTSERPVPPQYAVALAAMLGLKPEQVSAGYAQLQVAGAVAVNPDTAGDVKLRPDLEIARLQNDIHALNLALGALVVTMTRHRPTEAKDAAAAMRKVIPKKFRDRGLVHELLTTLDQA